MTRYQGSTLGITWVIIHPLLMLAVYTFVFGVVFKTRWPALTSGSTVEFALTLFSGLIAYNLFAEPANRACSLITSQANFVKKIVFPLEVLGWVNALVALVNALLSILVLLFAMLVFNIPIPISIIYSPILLLPILFLSVGFTWLFAALGVFVRDLNQVVGVLITALLFLSPIFFPLSALPENIRPLAQLNPMAFPIEQFREALLWGRTVNWSGWMGYLVLSISFSYVSFWVFRRLRPAMADVV